MSVLSNNKTYLADTITKLEEIVQELESAKTSYSCKFLTDSQGSYEAFQNELEEYKNEIQTELDKLKSYRPVIDDSYGWESWL